MMQSNGNWKRAIAWGEYFQDCETHMDCYNILNATRQNEVLDYVCKSVAMDNDAKVCLCNTRMLKQGLNCEELTMYSIYFVIPLKVVALLCVTLIVVKGIRTLRGLKSKKNAVFLALLLATAQAIASWTWMLGSIIRNIVTEVTVYRFAEYFIKYVSIPMTSVTVMMEHGVIAIAWQRSMASFTAMSQSKEAGVKWFERAVKLYLAVVPLSAIYFNIKGLFALTSLMTLVSLAGFTVGFVFVGIRLHGTLTHSSSSGTGSSATIGKPASSKTSSNNKSNASIAIRAIQVYTRKIAVGSVVAMACMLLFSVSDKMGVTSTEDNIFHLDAAMETLVALSIANCSRNIMNYIQKTKGKRGKSTSNRVADMSGGKVIVSNAITDTEDLKL